MKPAAPPFTSPRALHPAGWWLGVWGLLLGLVSSFAEPSHFILKPDVLAAPVNYFNGMEDENVTNLVANADSLAWLQKEIPLFACPDHEVQEMYYFRWWSFRKHLEQTPEGYVFSEFLTRPVPVSSALGHQIAEGRWLHSPDYLNGYLGYWLQHPAHAATLHKYSSWAAWAVYQRYLVTGDRAATIALLPDLIRDYHQWESEHLTPTGLFWQYDVRDAMEESISGSRTNKNLRPTINSYMYGNAQAIAAIARLAGDAAVADEFSGHAAVLKKLVESQLWNPAAQFFEVRRDNGRLADVREEAGFIPWMFNLPDAGQGYETAWSQLTDPTGFNAPAGITTAERRSPFFRTHGWGHCEWDGAVWPFATAQTLTALANLLRNYPPQNEVTARDYYHAFLTYVASQHSGGKPYVGEYLDETTGDWINGKGGRSRYYNHSTFADLLITGVVGLVPRADHTVEVHPLLPPGVWNWFCLDDVAYHGHRLTILWDQDGSHYGHGRGLAVFADGIELKRTAHLEPFLSQLP